ncbi:hypothetical protein [Actinoplanes sp. TFC3]|uniref:hypothetical protein n=1 Tax=Actinoplanes sp. TFC3 TaxID=1710355 RepID=UPI00082C4EEA|nr:hypothetical protein [Actinoplanes sp. TFC3]
MIVTSLLLILVAVLLLILGLAGGSSTLLISSIVASLLAAVALVIGARQAAARQPVGRRSTLGDPLSAEDTLISEQPPVAEPAYATADSTAPAEGSRWSGRRRRSAGPEVDIDAPTSIIPGIEDFPPPPGPATQPPGGPSPAGATLQPEETLPGEAAADPEATDDSEPDRAAAYAAGQRDAEAGLSGPSHPAAGPEADTGDVTERAEPSAVRSDESPVGDPVAERTAHSGADATRSGRRAAGSPDYDQAASVIGGARSADDESWRRTEGEQVAPEPAAEPVVAAGAGTVEYDDPDPEDPADEPLPQAVRPADAVRVARMDAAVVVVDGRPRYHLPACPFVAGKHPEPLPVSEAVELGFSPCGTCRPVDNLVAAASRH